jgi:predicted nuclease of predicted toxin-antitoxin system
LKALLDNNLSPRLAAALHILVEPDGHEVRHLRDRFAMNTPDIEWLAALGQEGNWVIISADQRIFRNRHEREAWRQSSLTIFFLARAWLRMAHLEQAHRLIQWWPRIVEQVDLVEPGAAFEVPVRAGHGRFRQLKV